MTARHTANCHSSYESLVSVDEFPGECQMADLFVSYSSADRELARELAEDLLSQGYTVWWDTHLLAGERFRKAIFEQLDASTAVIVIWTEASILSDWVVAEAERAHSQHKLISVRNSTLQVSRIPPPFGAIHHIVTIEDRAPLYRALAERLRTTPAYKIADGIREIYGQWGSASWGPKSAEVEQIILAFKPTHQIDMADRLAAMRLTTSAAQVEVMQGWWMLASLVQAILALFLTAHLESFRKSVSQLEMSAEILPVGMSLVALLNVVDIEEIFDPSDREMLNEIALSAEEARLSSVDKDYEKGSLLVRVIAWCPGFLRRLSAQLPELRHENAFNV